MAFGLHGALQRRAEHSISVKTVATDIDAD
jgi:hypothetical protein